MASTSPKPFQPGNPWRFTLGNQAALGNGMSLARMNRSVREYVTEQATTEKRLTWSGLAAFLGMTTTQLSNYRDGSVGRANDKEGFISLLNYYQTLMESRLETMVTDRDYATRGVVFALTNQFSDRWSETKTIKHETSDQRLIVQLHPDLAAKLEKSAGESISYTAPLDGVCSVVEDDTDDA